MNPVEGKNVVFSMKVDGTYYPVLCATDMTFSKGVEKIEKTGPTSGGVRQWMLRLEQYTSTISGLTYVENDDELSFFYLLQESVRREEQDFKLVFTDGRGDTISLTGVGLIGDCDINGPATDFSNCNIEILWNQEPEFDQIDPPEGGACIESPLYLAFTSGTSVSDEALEATGVEILHVEREGLGMTETSGTPVSGSREFKFTGGTGNGTIAFDADNPSTGDEVVYVLYRIA